MGRWSRFASLVSGVFSSSLAVLAGGCARGPKLPPLAAVSGTVTLDGKAAVRGPVRVHP